MSWGNKLVVVFIAFAALMATLVYNAVTTKFDLVTKDYYKEELRYQDKIDGRANAAEAGDIRLSQDASTVLLELPEGFSGSLAEGEAWFYCKTDAAKDLRIPVSIEEGRFVFDKARLSKTNYQFKLQFTVSGKQYYYTTFIEVS